MSTLRTPWKVVTTEETSGSLLLTLAAGTIYTQHESSGEKMNIRYEVLSVGAGKGPPVGASWSNTSDPSGAIGDCIGVVDGYTFGPLSFPCKGYMLGVGASLGVLGSILNMEITGGGLTIALFGIMPVFAGVRLWGFGRGALPGVGMTAGQARFWVE